MQKSLSMLFLAVVLWQGSVGESWEQKNDFRIVYDSSRPPETEQIFVERKLLNIDSQGVETEYWYTIGSGEDQVLRAAVKDLAGKK